MALTLLINSQRYNLKLSLICQLIAIRVFEEVKSKLARIVADKDGRGAKC